MSDHAFPHIFPRRPARIRPPDWLLAPHLRAAQPRPAPESRADATRHAPRPIAAPPRRIPFPGWRDTDGIPLAALLGPPAWRDPAP